MGSQQYRQVSEGDAAENVLSKFHCDFKILQIHSYSKFQISTKLGVYDEVFTQLFLKKSIEIVFLEV
jgi:hypothetical protein